MSEIKSDSVTTYTVTIDAVKIDAVKNAALDAVATLRELLISNDVGSTPYRDAAAKMAIAQAAISSPSAMVGTCGIDGTSLQFVGKQEGLHVCCAGNPQHCWKIA
jgi:hypothetical protein